MPRILVDEDAFSVRRWRTSRCTRPGTLSIVFIFSYILLMHIYLTRSSDPRTFQIPNDYSHGIGGAIDPTDWSALAREMQLLDGWGQRLMDNNTLSRSNFTTAIENRFPFMRNASNRMDTPWSTTQSGNRPGTGIVICAGSRNHRMAAHLIQNLKVVKSRLPITIAYAGDTDLAPPDRAFLRTLLPPSRLTFQDLLTAYPSAAPDLASSGFAIKPFALLAAPYRRAILVDADALFFKRPDDLFSTHRGLFDTGALFFHDRAVAAPNTQRHEFLAYHADAANVSLSSRLAEQSLFGAGKAYYEADSGVVAVDRGRTGVWMNTREVREAVTGELLDGDKETFWIAMELLGKRYSMPSWYAGNLGTVQGLDGSEDKVCGKHMLHVDAEGREPFWINGGVYEDKEDVGKGYLKATHWWQQDVPVLKDLPGWWWEEGSYGCVKGGGVRELDRRSRKVLDRTVEEARNIDTKLGITIS